MSDTELESTYQSELKAALARAVAAEQKAKELEEFVVDLKHAIQDLNKQRERLAAALSQSAPSGQP